MANTIAGGILGMMNTGLNYGMSRSLMKDQADYNELAAQRADARTRALFTDFESPAAQARQLREAGLSVGLMYGQGGMGGGLAQGAQSGGVGLPSVQSDMLNGMALMADIQKTKAETKKIEADTEKTEAETTMQNMQNEIISATSETQINTILKNYDKLWNEVRSAQADADIKESTKQDIITQAAQTTQLVIQQKLKLQNEVQMQAKEQEILAQQLVNLKLDEQIKSKEAAINNIWAELIKIGYKPIEKSKKFVEDLIDGIWGE